jgi:hypothetical protein
MAVQEYVGPLKSVIEKGQYEQEIEVCGDKVLLHLARVREEQAVNTATAHVPLLDRDYERWVARLARVVTRVNGHVFPTVDESTAFFVGLTQPHIEEYVGAYNKMLQEVTSRLASKAQEIKN